MKKDRLQVGLFDLDPGDIEAGAGSHAENGGKTRTGIFDQRTASFPWGRRMACTAPNKVPTEVSAASLAP